MNASAEPGPPILLADPDASLTAAARRVLERRGYRITTAADGEQALASLNSQFPVVIVSTALPKIDGLAVMRQIKARALDTQFILLTETSAIGSAMMGLQEGAFAYIIKPIADYLQLTHAVEHALELYRLRRLAPTSLVPARAKDRDVRLLKQVTEITSRSDSRTQVLESAIKYAAQLFDASKSVILLADKAQNLQLTAGLGSADQGAAARDLIRVVGEEFAWRVAKERRILTFASSDGKHMHVGAPLISRDRLIGVLIIYEIAPDERDVEKFGWLEAFAAQAAAAVELARLAEENDRLDPNDPATGAYKEARFVEVAEREFRRSWRFNESLSVIHIQVDGIETIYQRSGELGDRVLRVVSDVCRQSVRNIDYVGRGQDDSLTILLVMTDSAGAHIAAERILRAVNALTDQRPDGFRIILRLGIATYPHEGCTSVMDLLEIARAAHRLRPASDENLIERA